MIKGRELKPMPFTPEHEMFRDLVRRFVQDEITPHVDEWEERGEAIPRELYRRMGELGLLRHRVPGAVRRGGRGLLDDGRADGGVGAVPVGRRGVQCHRPYRYVVTVAGSGRVGRPEKRYLPDITSGRKVCALAITEPGAGSDMVSLETRAERDGDDWVLNGAKTYITNGVYGDLYFVAAKTRDSGRKHQRLSQFLVEAGTPGLKVSRKLSKTGMWASDTAELVFEDVRVPNENLLGEEGRGFYQLASGLQRERLLSAVLSVSAASQAVDDTLEFLKNREAFDKPLAEFQALRHRIADMATSSGGREAADLRRGRGIRERRRLRDRSLHGEALLHRDGESRCLRGGPDARRPRIHA